MGSIETSKNLIHRWHLGQGSGFEIFRSLLGSRYLAGDNAYLDILTHMDKQLESKEGSGFLVTPFAGAQKLGNAIGWQGQVWIKDETGHVSGSHKGRHMMGTMLYLEALRKIHPAFGKKVLAIYSCGNAALAAASVARAGGYELHTFVPENVNPGVAAMLTEKGAQVNKMIRMPGILGDPCYLAFRNAVEQKGWIPFSCSGNDNWSNIEGGETLGWEMVMQLMEAEAAVSGIVLQVGGGALGRSVIQAWEELYQMGIIDALPRFYACQPEGSYPFARAYYLLLKEIARANGLPMALRYERDAEPTAALSALKAFSWTQPDEIRSIIKFAKDHFYEAAIQNRVREALEQPGQYMWAWDGTVPKSLANGILDDETYDWYDLLVEIIKTGGKVEIIKEETIKSAHQIAQRYTTINSCATGTAGLAGLMQLKESGDIDPEENIGLLFTGVNRNGEGL